MEAAQPERAEVDVPEVVVDFLEAYVLAAEDVTDIDPVGVPPDAAVVADLSDLEVVRILERLWSVGERSVRGTVNRGRGVLSESLVRSFVVVGSSKGVEPPLL